MRNLVLNSQGFWQSITILINIYGKILCRSYIILLKVPMYYHATIDIFPQQGKTRNQ